MLDPQLPTFGCPTNLVQPIRLVMADNHSSDPCHILGQAQGKFAAKGRQLIMQLGTEFVLGAPTLDVPGLLEPLDITINDATDVQTFSKIYMFQFQNVKTADRIALTYLLILFMRVSSGCLVFERLGVLINMFPVVGLTMSRDIRGHAVVVTTHCRGRCSSRCVGRF